MKQQKIKLGARTLTDEEVDLILPNAKQVYDQIEVFRSNISEESGNEQKTNNIGIMGCRGAGKTSILKTFYNKLYKEQKATGDILLPIIIPENMSSAVSLMDVILGMFKPVVKRMGDERKKKQSGKRGPECIYSGRDELEKIYNDMVRQYCYIKKDYRDILIQQFTTEQYYLDKTKEVFNSDSEFIKLFGEFIKILCKYAEEGKSEEKDGIKDNPESPAMIFLFIDDIDLSTARCMDVVKVLLSYLSNQRIVTFISGDLDTFEEALTLDFLRQENALDAKVFQTTYMNRKVESLLIRKKTLAYEYLRKVIPPAYRKTIKRWSLEERGDFQVADEEGKSQNRLAELLTEVTKGYIDGAYFTYADVNEIKSENENKEKARRKSHNVIFHMFDDTSRGINNVYNVLQELWELKNNENENSENTENRKLLIRLIEAMIDSKELFAKYREQLLGQIIVVLQDKVKVDFESALHWLYGDEAGSDDKAVDVRAELEQANKEETNGQASGIPNKKKVEERKIGSKDSFSIFLLIDFAGRIFSEDMDSNIHYMKLKNKIVEEYIYDETIDGKIAAKRKKICLNGDNWNEKNIGGILTKLLQCGEFMQNLYFIQFLGRDRIYRILDEGSKERDDVYEVAYALKKSVQAMNESQEEESKYLIQMYSRMKEVMLALLDLLPLNADIIYGEELLKDVPEEAKWYKFLFEEADSEENLAIASTRAVERCFVDTGARDKYAATYLRHRYSMYWIYYEICMRESRAKDRKTELGRMAMSLISRGLVKAKMKQFSDIMNRFQIQEITEERYSDLLKRDDTKEKEVIVQIDEEKLWNNIYVKDIVYPFLNKKRWRYIRSIYRKILFFDIREIIEENGGYYQFVKCNKGVSGKALVCKLEKKLKEFFFLERDVNKVKGVDGITYYMSLDQVLIIQCMLEEFLQDHPGIKLGKKETKQLLMEIRELPLVMQTEEGVWEELFEKENKFVKQLERGVAAQLGIDERMYFDLMEKMTKGGIKQFGNNEQIIGENLEQYYDEKEEKIDEEEIAYWMCLVQDFIMDNSEKFDELKDKKWVNKSMSVNNSIEYDEDKNNFYLHSYLRYLQAENNGFDTLGIRAETVANFTKELLDNETIAAELVQKDIYNILTKKMELTEEDFESLFN